MLGSRYELVMLIGEGGMSHVYLARSLERGRNEAVKVLKPELASDERLVARFRREARATSRLHHPNIVALHDYGTLPDGRFYIAMEYVDGVPLTTLIEQGPLPVPRALDILCQAAVVVEHAHSRGVLHRDLKPANLMLVTRSGRPDMLKVLDFGIAKIISPEYQESMVVSQEGIVMGTPLYMAPEQLCDGSHDARSDIYALGCIAFELFTGEPPFRGLASKVILDHVQSEPPQPSSVADDIPPELDQVILTCLEKDPGQRYQSGGELLAALVPLHQRHDQVIRDTQNHPVPDLARYELFDASVPTDPMGYAGLWSHDGGDERDRQAAIDTALLELGRAMLAHAGHDADRDLVSVVTEIRGLDDALERCDAERDALSARQGEVEAAARERQERLRFAIASLHEERARGSADTTLDSQIRALEERLVQVEEQDLAQLAGLADQALGLAARHAELGEERRVACDHLARIVAALAPRFEGSLAPLLSRYRALSG